MYFLLDCFSPAELLHMVSMANKFQFLATDQKRYLIALRMAGAPVDAKYSLDAERKTRFYAVLGQFLRELRPSNRCEKDACPLCDRFHDLRIDFHGDQSSTEFRLFMDWFEALSPDDYQGAPEGFLEGLPNSPAPVEAIVQEIVDKGESPASESHTSLYPLLVLNENHPLIRHASALVQTDLDELSDKTLRAYAESLRQVGQRLLSLLG